MKKLVLPLVAVAAVSFCLKFASAADESGKTEQVKGVLIDDHCAAKMMKQDNPQAAAEKHKVSCANKCIKDDGASVVLISGKDELKLDSKGQELAKDFLSSHKKADVVVTGEKSGDELKVTEINAAPAKG
ncbi:MAG TPA: hypothetical protein VGI81_04750 [Tepidisphaeraceae bacterium]|jgi:hypothetical protein